MALTTSGPRLALHEVLRLDLESEGTITVADQILIRPRRTDWSRPAGNAALYGLSARLRPFSQKCEKPFLFSGLWPHEKRWSLPGLRAGRGGIQRLTTAGLR